MSSLQLQFHANVLEDSRVLQEICLLQREFLLQLQIHANVLEEVECCKNISFKGTFSYHVFQTVRASPIACLDQ
jgi:hypothetical protein